ALPRFEPSRRTNVWTDAKAITQTSRTLSFWMMKFQSRPAAALTSPYAANGNNASATAEASLESRYPTGERNSCRAVQGPVPAALPCHWAMPDQAKAIVKPTATADAAAGKPTKVREVKISS